MTRAPHPFEEILSVAEADIGLKLGFFGDLAWEDFFLNPRKLRGSDFLMRWSQGVWSESRILDAVNESSKYFAIPYGPSGTAPTEDVRAYEIYFERLEKAGLGKIKRPDVLIFKKEDQKIVNEIIRGLGGVQELPFLKEEDLEELLSRAVVAIEAENSLWRSKKMPDYLLPLTPQKRLGGKLGLKKKAVLPTIIIKEQDREPLKKWQEAHGIKIHIWHVFFDQAFGISLDGAERLMAEGLIEPSIYTYQAPGGATTKKPICFIYYRYCYPLGEVEEPTHRSASVEDKNGHILPYVTFHGGKLKLSHEAISVLDSIV